VLVDGTRMNGCLTLAVQCDGREVTTVEGLADGDELSPVQQAFRDLDAFQCGYCTPGQLVSATACIAEGHATDPATVREWMSGNICRCSSYPQITAAVLTAAQASR
jgi:xanthine dehydrogenase YagT iron-sulfur-binding subunit